MYIYLDEIMGNIMNLQKYISILLYTTITYYITIKMLNPTGLDQLNKIMPNILKEINDNKYEKAANLLEDILKNTVHKTVYYIVKAIICVLKRDIEYETKFKYETNIDKLYDMKNINNWNIKKLTFSPEICKLFEKYKNKLYFAYFIYLCYNYDNKYLIDYYTKNTSAEERVFLGFIQDANAGYFENIVGNDVYIKYIIGVIYHEKDSTKKAKNVFSGIIKNNPNHVYALYRLYRLTNDKKYIEKVLTIDPNYNYATHILSYIQYQLDKDIDTLLKSTVALQKLHPNCDMFFAFPIQIYEQLNKNKELEKCYIKLLTMNHTNQDIIALLLVYYSRDGTDDTYKLKVFSSLYKLTDNEVYLEEIKHISRDKYNEIVCRTNVLKTGPFDTCSICMNSYDSTDGYGHIVILTCSHDFHLHCIKKLQEQENSDTIDCPICRQKHSDLFEVEDHDSNSEFWE